MNLRKNPFWVQVLLIVGGLLCAGWVVASLRALIDSATEADTFGRIFRGLGPLGMALAVLGIVITTKRRDAG